MNINGIDIPNNVIEAIRNDKLVVFAGAGVSMNEPTNLVSFEGLINEIVKNTGYKYNNESIFYGKPDVFLGRLEHDGVNVKKMAADYFKSRTIVHSQMHKNIIDLFKDNQRIRLVTTNYEYAFEDVLEGVCDVKVYSYPALPLGNDFEGIVHIHGNYNESKHMILTDSDFGRAYLLDGIVSKFLTKLFEEYTILFLGYSHEDVIMKYFSRGLPLSHTASRYIFTDQESKTDWEMYGLKPIHFPENDYNHQIETLKMISERSHRDFMSWESKIEYISKALPPQQLEGTDEIKEIANDSVLLKLFICNFNISYFKEWFESFLEIGLLNFLGNDSYTNTENELLSWIITEDIKKYRFSNLMGLLSDKKNEVSDSFFVLLFVILHAVRDSIEKEVFERILLMFGTKMNKITQIYKWDLIEHCFKNDLISTGITLYFENLLPVIAIQEKLLSVETNKEYEGRYDDKEAYFPHQIWNEYITKKIKDYKYKILHYSKNEIEKQDAILSIINEGKDVDIRLLFIDVEKDWIESNQSGYSSLFVKMLFHSLDCFSNEGYSFVISDTLLSKSAIVRKVGLISLRHNDTLKADEKYVYIKDYPLYDIVTKTEIFRLVSSLYGDLNNTNKNDIINKILLKMSKKSINDTDIYSVYNWLIWLRKIYEEDILVKQSLEKNEEHFKKYKPRDHPELNIHSYDTNWVSEKSPIDLNHLKSMEIEELFEYIDSFKDVYISNDESYSKRKIYDLIATEIVGNMSYRINIIEYMKLTQRCSHDLWEYVLRGMDKEIIVEDQFNYLINELIDEETMILHGILISKLLNNIIKNENVKEEWVKNQEVTILEILEFLFDNPKYRSIDQKSYVSTAFNGTSFAITDTLIHLLELHGNIKGMPKNYSRILLKFTSEDSSESKYTSSIIFGNYKTIYNIDNSWFENNLLPILSSENNDLINSSWEGLLTFNSIIYKDSADLLINSFRDARSKFSEFISNNKEKYMDAYAVLMYHYVDNSFEEYNTTVRELVKNGYNNTLPILDTITRMLKNTKDNKELINKWDELLFPIIKSSNLNLPKTYTDEELLYLISWLPYSNLDFNESVNCILANDHISITNFFKIAGTIKELIVKYTEEEFLDSKYQLIVYILNCNFHTTIPVDQIEKYIESLGAISKEKKSEIRSLLLKKNIKLT